MSFIEHLSKLKSESNPDIINCGTLNQFKTIAIHPKGNAVLADDMWITIGSKYRGQEPTRDWTIIQCKNEEGEVRVVTCPPAENSWKTI